MAETAMITLKWTGDYTKPEDIVLNPKEDVVINLNSDETYHKEDETNPTYAYCMILRKRRVKGVPGYRVLHVSLMKDDESVAASRAMFERIAAEQRGKGMVVARVGIPVVTDSGDLQIKTLETIKHYLISRLKVTVSSELEITGEDSENDLSSRIAPITFEVARVTVENTGFYAPLKKRLDTFGQGSPTFALTKRVIGRIPGEVDDWLRHLAEDSRDSLETFCLAERALELAEARFGPDDPVTAKYLRLLAFCCVRQFRYEEAEELLRRQLAIYVKEYGRISLDTAGVLANLAGALNHQRRSKQALPLMREALRIGKKIQGPDSVETGKFCFNLGTIYEDLNRDEWALQYYRKARSILEEALGAGHAWSGRSGASRALSRSPAPSLC